MKKLITALLALTLTLSLCGCENKEYTEAMDLYEAGKYEEALPLLEALGDYEDCTAKAQDCRYQIALELMDEGEYQQAIDAFTQLGDYENSADMLTQCQNRLIDTALEGSWFDTSMNQYGLESNFDLKDGNIEVFLTVSGMTEKMNTGSYRVDYESKTVYVLYDVTGTLDMSSGTMSTEANTEEKELFSYEYNDGTLTLKIIDTDSVLEKR